MPRAISLLPPIALALLLAPACQEDPPGPCGSAPTDCAGVCGGEASLDGCGVCSGGTTGVTPSTADADADGPPDSCATCPDKPWTQSLIVEWSHVMAYDGSGGPYTFEVELRDSGDIVMQYAQTEPWSERGAIGVQAPGGLDGLTVALDSEDFFDTHRVVPLSSMSGTGGYSYDSASQPDYSWLNLAGLGSEGPLEDDQSFAVQLPFDFPFYGSSQDAVWVSPNGTLWFGDEDPGYGGASLPDPLYSSGIVAVLWTDLNPTPGTSTIRSLHRESSCAIDCAGVEGGLARVDDCGECTGGSTDLLPNASMDCAEVCGGEALIDSCGICAGGTTGIEPTTGDCKNLPDFVADSDYLASSTYIEYMDIPADSCLLGEGCVNGTGTRKLLRFGTRVGNIGPADFYLGSPPGEHFYYDSCHGHHHVQDYADYQLLDPDTGLPVVKGHKNGFCLMDLDTWDPELAESNCNVYDCDDQGISKGCADIYSASLSCQWVDVTGIDDGTYRLSVEINPYSAIPETNFENNSAAALVEISGDSVSVVGR